MSRLTINSRIVFEKYYKEHPYIKPSKSDLEDYYYPEHNISKKQCYHKLGQLEDIEEKLGIDLITLFKALTQGFWIRRPRGTRPQTYSYEFVNPKDDDDIHNEVSLDIYHKCIYYYDNYMQWRCGARRFAYDLKTYRAKKGFAWALTKEELEWKD